MKYTTEQQHALDKAILVEQQKAEGKIPGGNGQPWDGCIIVESVEHGGRVRIRADEYDPEKHTLEQLKPAAPTTDTTLGNDPRLDATQKSVADQGTSLDNSGKPVKK